MFSKLLKRLQPGCKGGAGYCSKRKYLSLFWTLIFGGFGKAGRGSGLKAVADRIATVAAENVTDDVGGIKRDADQLVLSVHSAGEGTNNGNERGRLGARSHIKVLEDGKAIAGIDDLVGGANQLEDLVTGCFTFFDLLDFGLIQLATDC